jgi:hypothetical protein
MVTISTPVSGFSNRFANFNRFSMKASHLLCRQPSLLST